jgi:hypothetical protein
MATIEWIYEQTIRTAKQDKLSVFTFHTVKSLKQHNTAIAQEWGVLFH